jgi:nucleoside-diphosphate-sugar epimerase
MHVTSEPTTFNETDWNDQAPAEIERLGRDASAWQKYRASKSLAERAAWDLWNAHKDAVHWDLVTLNPPYVSFCFVGQGGRAWLTRVGVWAGAARDRGRSERAEREHARVVERSGDGHPGTSISSAAHPAVPSLRPESGADSSMWQDNATLATGGGSWIDVRDLALAHRLALEKEAAGGERIIVRAGPIKWQDLRASPPPRLTLPSSCRGCDNGD